MSGAKLVLAVSGYSQAGKKLEKLMAMVKRPSVPAVQCAVWLTGQTIRAFNEGGRPEKWAPMGLMTAFIRSHREGAKNADAVVMNDIGRLRGSFVPVTTDDGNQFGSATNVSYAALMQRGGVSEPNEVSIASYTKNRGSHQARDYARGSLTSGTIRVKAYIMHLKGGQKIPARPFFPEGMSELKSWGYHEKIKEIFALYFKNTDLGGAI